MVTKEKQHQNTDPSLNYFIFEECMVILRHTSPIQYVHLLNTIFHLVSVQHLFQGHLSDLYLYFQDGDVSVPSCAPASHLQLLQAALCI